MLQIIPVLWSFNKLFLLQFKMNLFFQLRLDCLWKTMFWSEPLHALFVVWRQLYYYKIIIDEALSNISNIVNTTM